MQTYHHQDPPQVKFPASMASFAVRLMSLNAHELRCLNADNELMRQLGETQSLMESRLQDINHQAGANSAAATLANISHNNQLANGRPATAIEKLQQQHIQLAATSTAPLNLNLRHNQQHLQQQQQHQQLLLSPNGHANYYQNYYAQQLALAQMAHLHQQQHQQQQQQSLNQQQLFLLASKNLISPDHQLNANNLTNINQPISPSENHLRGHHNSSNNNNNANNQHQQQSHNQHRLLNQQPPALDLRTTPTRPMSALSASPSPVGRANSAGSGQLAPLQHPKKLKLSEYRKMQQLAERGANLEPERYTAAELDELHDQNRKPVAGNQIKGSDGPVDQLLTLPTHSMPNNNNNTNADSIQHNLNGLVVVQKQLQSNKCSSSIHVTSKKYKGEFDEPIPAEVMQRELDLDRPEHYHKQAIERGKCACVLGSVFKDKSSKDVLEMIERWRSLDVEQRIKWKWDVNDLPKDIPLSDIKKFEDLRREYSDGRADFGGASKRKPLGIRGTRQFLLILYCLWGHPGRDDPMQRDGYCPHCFAKIKKANEQSTLVRVVNHFNMKHRRGANPRLSPQLENNNNSSGVNTNTTTVAAAAAATTTTATTTTTTITATNNGSINTDDQSPSLLQGQIRDTLLSVVEAASATAAEATSPKAEPGPPSPSEHSDQREAADGIEVKEKESGKDLGGQVETSGQW